MKSRINVEVTAKDIERAQVNDSYKCVVSQALMRTLPDAHHPDTDVQSIRFTDGDGIRWQFLTPYAVQGYIVAFDAGDKIEPFAFQLRDGRQIRRRVKTPVGKKADAARAQATRDALAAGAPEAEVKAKAAKAASKTKTAAAKTVEVVTPDDQDITPKDALALSELVTEGLRPAPRMYKKKQRSYGHRVMRINQNL